MIVKNSAYKFCINFTLKNIKKILIIGNVWAESRSSAAGARMMYLLDFFIRNDFQLTFISAAEKSAFSDDLTQLKIQTKQVKLNDASCEEFIQTLAPDFVIFDRFMIEEQFGWKIRELCPNALTILDTEDLHFLRFARQEQLKNGEKLEDYIYSDKTKREIAALLRCDLSLIISEVEFDLLVNQFNISENLLLYFPILMKKREFKKSDFSQRSDFMFIGNMLHEPNIDSVYYLKKEIWPKIKAKIPSAKLKIYGAYIPEKITQLNNEQEAFLICGRAEEVSEIMNDAKVLLAPLRFGAGQKGKLLEAMFYNLPSVTTAIGAESMYGNLPWNGFISDNPDEFSSFACDLYQSQQKWEIAVENGKNILEKRYNEGDFEQVLLEKIIALKSNLSEHRNSNFIGQILQQSTLNSYKYMSKWIEEKNRKGN